MEQEPKERQKENDTKRRELAHRRFLLTPKRGFEGEGRKELDRMDSISHSHGKHFTR
jgi:hypothetical protein